MLTQYEIDRWITQNDWKTDSLGRSQQYSARYAEYFKKGERVEIRILNAKNNYTGEVGNVSIKEFLARPTEKNAETNWAIQHCQPCPEIVELIPTEVEAWRKYAARP